MEARMKIPEAKSSCSPPASPCVAWEAGNAGESIQMSSGTVAMRLNVMEFGRFMGLVLRRRAALRPAVALEKYAKMQRAQPLAFCHTRQKSNLGAWLGL